MIEFIKHWTEIAYMAAVCLWQEVRGQEPDCPACWKCEMMRFLLICTIGVAVIRLLKWWVA